MRDRGGRQVRGAASASKRVPGSTGVHRPSVSPPGADSRQATGPLLTPALRPPTHGAEETPAGQPGLPSLRGHCLGGAPGPAACASDARCPELILTLPPPGTCLILSLEPHLD